MYIYIYIYILYIYYTYILLTSFRHTVFYENFLIYTKTLSLSLSQWLLFTFNWNEIMTKVSNFMRITLPLALPLAVSLELKHDTS